MEDWELHDRRKKKKVPNKFVVHILSLGFNEEDADRLFEEKDNWTGVSTDGKVFCVVKGCKFYTKIASDELFEHCRVKHQWKDYPCPDENCNFIAYSITALRKHALFHSRSPSTQYPFSCSKQNCKCTFRDRVELRRHENIHDNVLFFCVYCPYTCVQARHLSMHQREHFNIRDFKCDICSRLFKQQGELNNHFNARHSGVNTKCFLCNFEGSIRNVHRHINRKHGLFGYRWDGKSKKFFKPE